MSRERILLVAHDTAPSRCFEMLLRPLQQSSMKVLSFLGAQQCQESIYDALKQYMKLNNFVLIGMSSSEEYAEIELKVAQFAHESGVPYGFYSDTKFAINRAAPGFWFHDVAQDASLVVGVMHKGAAILFPKAHKVQTGNPLDEAMSFLPFERGMSRNELGVKDADILVHVAGGKFPASNCTMLMLVAEAVAQIHDGRRWQVVFTPHPGDPAREYPLDMVGTPQLYAEIAKYSPVPLQVILEERMSSGEVLVGSDVLVELTGSVSRTAAYQRIPVVSLHGVGTDTFFKAEGGMLPYELVAAGAAVPAKYDVQVLANDLRMLVVPGEPIRERILANQRKNYIPSTERGVAVRAICDALVGQIK